MPYAVMGETEHGAVCIRRGFPNREAAEDHPVKMSLWKRVWVQAEPEPRNDTGVAAPRPWSIGVSSTSSNNDSFHLYLVDANGRKIAAIWGRSGEKLATAEMILAAINGSEE